MRCKGRIPTMINTFINLKINEEQLKCIETAKAKVKIGKLRVGRTNVVNTDSEDGVM